MAHTDRVVVLVDMDCFYCQVEEKLNPVLKGKPLAVVQYNEWRGGGIIAVNYPARKRGVTRHMRGDEAKKKCPEIELVRVATARDKADLSKYRDAGKLVANVLQTFSPLLERASVDEAYLDITEAVAQRISSTSKDISLSQIKNTRVVGCDVMDFLYNLYNSGLCSESNLKLAFGGVIAEEIRAAVFEQTGYTCSAGIAHNKILAKLACGLHKPNQQTILPQDNVLELYKDLPVHKIYSLGGKFGHTLSEDLGITNMSELLKFTEKDLAKLYDQKTASWLYKIARGINLDPVTTRVVSKSIGCCKKFPGKSALIGVDSVKHWMNELAQEIVERLENDLAENNRKAKQMVISFSQEVRGKDVASSRTHVLTSYDSRKVANDAFEVVKKHCLKANGTFCLKFLGISAGKFEDCRNVNSIMSFFKTARDSSKDNTNLVSDDQQDTSRSSQQPKDYELPSNIEQDACIENKAEMSDSLSDHNFSATTVVLEEDSSELVFLNEDVNQPGNASDSDSISNELCDKDRDESDSASSSKQSFFLRYFENLKNRQRKSPVLRDFDTSRHLEEALDDEDVAENNEDSVNENNHEDEDFPPNQEALNKEVHVEAGSSSTHAESINLNMCDVPGTSRDVFEFKDTAEICPECSKKIMKSEMVSHMDYHFALKMVREESHLYKKDNAKPLSSSRKDSAKSMGKRKSADVDKNATLETFLKGNAVQLGDVSCSTEVCPQCNKRVALASLPSHLDYHVAKKLHLEINPVPSRTTESLKISKSAVNGKAKAVMQAKSSVRSIAAFFKPIS